MLRRFSAFGVRLLPIVKLQEDSTPHFCDSTADIVRNARNDRALRSLFGTESFPARNACAGFCTNSTLLSVRLYHCLPL